jgi:hypothetical protein
MPNSDLYSDVKAMAENASVKAQELSGGLGSVRDFITDTFGQNGLIACYVLLGVISVLLVSKLAKLTFSALKFLVIPSVALAVLATFVLTVPFVAALPVTVTGCSLVLLFKG